MWRSWLALMMVAVMGSGSSNATYAADPPVDSGRGAVLELTEENDWFAGTDRHYTQGFRAVYLGAEQSRSHVLKDFVTPGMNVNRWRVGFLVGQVVFTPENLLAINALASDRPYAGWLYAGPVLQRRGVTPSAGVPVLETFQLQMGVVGPGSLAKEEQNEAHFVGGSEQAEGWHNQLPNEPGLVLKYQRTWRLGPAMPRDWCTEFLPHVGVSLGNVETSARVGGTFRVGWHVPDDFGVQLIDDAGLTDGGRYSAGTNQPFGGYLFFRAEGCAVGWNEFLDGSLFRRGRAYVGSRPFFGDVAGGVVLVFARVDLAFTMVYRAEEFYGQHAEDAFGSVSVSSKF